MKIIKSGIICVLVAASLVFVSCGSTKKAKAAKAEVAAPEDAASEETSGTESADESTSVENGKKSGKKNKKEKKAKKAKKGKKGNGEEAAPDVDSEGTGKNKVYIGWVEAGRRDIEYKNGIIKIKAKPKSGTYNLSVFTDNGKYLPVLSTRDEYTGSAFYLKVNKKIYKLNADVNIKTMAKKSDTGLKMLYRIHEVADVEVDFDTFPSVENGDADMIKVTATVTNLGTKKAQFSLKTILDTVLGESTSYHFYTSDNEPVKSEVMYRDTRDSKWFISKNSEAKFYVFIGGRDSTPIDSVALANYTTLDIKSWEPDMLSYRAFDTVLSYNNSAINLAWPRADLAVEESATFTYYLGFSVDNNKSACDEYMWPKETEVPQGEEVPAQEPAPAVEIVPAAPAVVPAVQPVPAPVPAPVPQPAPVVEPVPVPAPEPVVKNVAPVVTEPELPKEVPVVKFDISKLTKEQLSPEYIQSLLDKIASLEEDDTTINRDEILQLNAELDAILEVLKL